MDSSLLVSNVASLVSAIATAVSTTYKYGSSVTGASKARKDFLQELCAIEISLTSLKHVVYNADVSSPGYLSTSTALSSHLSDCRRDIEELQTALQNNLSSGKMKKRIHNFTWPFQEEEMQKRIERLSRYQGVFQNALAVDTW